MSDKAQGPSDRPAPLVKGSDLIELVKWARAERSAYEKVLPPATRDFLETRILVGSWYPEAHLEYLLAATDRVHGNGDLAFCRTLGRMSAKNQLQGTYKPAIASGDPHRTLALLPTLWPLHHNTGSAEMRVVSKHHFRFIVTGFGHPNRPHCASMCGWLEGAVAEAGGQAEVTEESCCNRGHDACVYEVRWTIAT